MSSEKLSIYLNDHLAAATAAIELARRVARSNRGNRYGAELAELSGELERERARLLEAMQRLGVGRDHVKILASWLAEKVGRFKLNGELLRYSPLSRLEELELLALGAHGRVLLWEALRASHGRDPRLRGINLGEALAAARDHRRRLERLRRRAAPEALRERPAGAADG